VVVYLTVSIGFKPATPAILGILGKGSTFSQNSITVGPEVIHQLTLFPKSYDINEAQ